MSRTLSYARQKKERVSSVYITNENPKINDRYDFPGIQSPTRFITLSLKVHSYFTLKVKSHVINQNKSLFKFMESNRKIDYSFQ